MLTVRTSDLTQTQTWTKTSLHQKQREMYICCLIGRWNYKNIEVRQFSRQPVHALCAEFPRSSFLLLKSWQQHSCYQAILYKIDMSFFSPLSKCHVCRFKNLTKKYEMYCKWQIVSMHMSISMLKIFYQYKMKWFYAKKWLTEPGFCYCNLSTAEHSINRLVTNNYFAAIIFQILTNCSHFKLVTSFFFSPVSATLS